MSQTLQCGIDLVKVGKQFPPTVERAHKRTERLGRLRELLKGVLLSPRRAGSQTSSNANTALSDVSLAITPGTVLGLVGGLGAGKTTLLRVMMGLERPTCGSVRLRGRAAAIMNLDEGACHRRLSVRDNILMAASRLRLGPRWIRANLREITAFAGLQDSLETPLGETPPEAYRRLAFALALRAQAEILLVDELFLACDAELQEMLRQEISSRRDRGLITVLAAPQMAGLLPLCTHIGQLVDGRLVDCQLAHVAAVAPAASDANARTRRHWFWVTSVEGWSAYIFIRADKVQRCIDKGQTLLPATPPWVDEQGNCPVEPWRPDCAGSSRIPHNTSAGETTSLF